MASIAFVFFFLAFSLAAISVDRYFAICKPFSYKSKSTKNTKIIITLYVTLAIILGYSLFFGWNSGLKITDGCDLRIILDFDYCTYVYFGSLSVSALVICISYLLIYRQYRDWVSLFNLNIS